MSGRKLANFELHDLLGEGAMGQVYRAVDLNLDRTVAVKLLSSKIDFDPTFSERFKREARLAAKLNHPNIATIYAFGEENGEAYIAMEFVAGKTLQQQIRDQALTYEEIRKYGIQIASALELAHSMEIVHRDIKSSNLMITASGDIKVMDFGVARRGGETQLTMDGALVGTANIMAPEVVKGAEAVPASDLFSVGCVLYEAITGQTAFAGDNAMAVLYNIMHEEPVSLLSTRGDIPADLLEVVNGLLTKDPETRLGPARAIVERLSGAAGSQVSLPPPPTGETPTMVLPAGAVSAEGNEGVSGVADGVNGVREDAPRKSWISNPLIWGGGVVVVTAAIVLAVLLGRDDPRAEAAALTAAGERLIQTGDPRARAAAADSFRKALQVDPDYEVAYNNLGQYFIQERRWAEAIQNLRDALRLKPDYIIALNNLGLALRGDGKLAAARDTLLEAIRINAGYAAAHYNLAEVHYDLKDSSRAKTSYRNAIEQAKSNETSLAANCLNGLGTLYLRDKPDSARAVFLDSIAREPNFANWRNLGRAYKALNRPDSALVAFEQAIQINPGDTRAMAGKAWADSVLSK